jgi:hypothetical protein
LQPILSAIGFPLVGGLPRPGAAFFFRQLPFDCLQRRRKVWAGSIRLTARFRLTALN